MLPVLAELDVEETTHSRTMLRDGILRHVCRRSWVMSTWWATWNARHVHFARAFSAGAWADHVIHVCPYMALGGTDSRTHRHSSGTLGAMNAVECNGIYDDVKEAFEKKKERGRKLTVSLERITRTRSNLSGASHEILFIYLFIYSFIHSFMRPYLKPWQWHFSAKYSSPLR